MARLSTDGHLMDLRFPQSEGHGNSIRLSASTLKQHGKNGKFSIVSGFQPFLRINLIITLSRKNSCNCRYQTQTFQWVSVYRRLSIFSFCFVYPVDMCMSEWVGFTPLWNGNWMGLGSALFPASLRLFCMQGRSRFTAPRRPALGLSVRPCSEPLWRHHLHDNQEQILLFLSNRKPQCHFTEVKHRNTKLLRLETYTFNKKHLALGNHRAREHGQFGS